MNNYNDGDLWDNNKLQFGRLIAELEATGAFTEEVLDKLCNEMDLTVPDICCCIERAQQLWDETKERV